MDYKTLTSQELIEKCCSGEAEAWQEFVRRSQPLIAGVVARTALSWTKVPAQLVDDLVQETYLRLCDKEFRRLRAFQSRHEDAIYGFLKAVAYSVTVDYFKSQNAVKRGGKVLCDADFEKVIQTASCHSELEHIILLQELEEIAMKVIASKRDKLIFLLYYRQGFSAKEISEMPGIELGEKGVESCLHKISQLLK